MGGPGREEHDRRDLAHSEELVGRVPEGTEVDIDRAVAAARDAFDHGDWSRMEPAERAAIVQNFSNVYAGQMMEMAAIVTEEMGSPSRSRSWPSRRRRG